MKGPANAPNPIVTWFKDADQYLFGFGSPTTLGIYRILFGFWAFVNYAMLLPFWRVWFSESGFMPAWLGRLWYSDHSELPSMLQGFAPNGFPRLNVLNGITDPRITFPFYLMVLVLAALTCIGLGTRVSSFLLMIGVVSLHHRNGAILHGGDTMQRLTVIYMAVMPCGKACSLDRLIGLWRGTETRQPQEVSLWAQRLLQYNLALVYFTTVWYKWDGERWRNLTAVYYPSSLAEFYRFPVPDFTRSTWFTHIATVGTVLTEFSLGTMVFFPPTRKYVLAAGVMMHAWIEYSMNIPLFSFLMISSYIVFFNGDEIAAWALRVGMRLRKFHLEIRLPASKKLTPRGVSIFSALDPLGLVSVLPGEGPAPAASTFGGKSVGLDRGLFKRLIGGWIFLWVPGLPTKLLNACLETAEIKDVEVGEVAALPKPETVPPRREARRGSLKR